MQRRRQLVFFYLRPTLYDALAERAERRGGDLNAEILGVLERDVLPPRRRGRAHLRVLTNETPASSSHGQSGRSQGSDGRSRAES
jgi:hypothetical protein